MTARILAFPDRWQRNDIEFDKTGSTQFTRLLDQIEQLASHWTRLERAERLSRLDQVDCAMASLAWRQNDLDASVALIVDRCAVEAPICEVPKTLRALA